MIFPASTNLLPCSSAYNHHVDRIVIADQLLLLHKIAFIHGVVAAPFCGLRIPRQHLFRPAGSLVAWRCPVAIVQLDGALSDEWWPADGLEKNGDAEEP